jgi:hypothetical protein
MRTRPTTWTVLRDPEGRNGVAYGQLKVPETYLVSPAGLVVAKFEGRVTARVLDQAIGR